MKLISVEHITSYGVGSFRWDEVELEYNDSTGAYFIFRAQVPSDPDMAITPDLVNFPFSCNALLRRANSNILADYAKDLVNGFEDEICRLMLINSGGNRDRV